MTSNILYHVVIQSYHVLHINLANGNYQV